MSTRIFSADRLYPVDQDPIDNGYVAFDANGKVESIGDRKDLPTTDVLHFDGILIPGMVNAHCHLELSHMVGRVDTGTGLLPFLKKVVTLREVDIEIIMQAISDQDMKMYESGISAVGDISNTSHTHQTKMKSPIRYYSFVEMFDFMQSAATEATIEQYRNVYKDQAHESGNKRSFVPHAPYSVSEGLFDFINRANPDNATISIHNQETLDEELLFADGSGRFPDFFKGFNVSLDGFTPLKKTSIHYALQHMTPKKKNIFVHNTLTTKSDIAAAHNWSSDVYWATCPNANLYIENRLPHYQNFLDSNAKMTIGTDSIMSNWQLSIWEEIKTIKKMQSYVPLTDLLTWATINGAEALGYQKSMGTIEVGKKAGLVHVDIEWRGDDTDISSSNAMRVY
jgi:cytosine/adenosine deaminase-related metal-dependent hydrolase